MVEVVYQSDRATLWLADCREVLSLVSSVAAVIVDPPYGVGFGGKNTKHTRRQDAGYDQLSDDENYVGETVIPVIRECISRFARVIVTPGVRCLTLYPRPDDMGCVYCPSGAGVGPWGFVCCHPILYYGTCPYVSKGLGSRPNSFSSTESAGESDHPCPKPIGWMRWLVDRGTLPGQTVLDTFAGSGTTGVACIEMDRKFLGVEIDPEYAKLAAWRLGQAEIALERPHRAVPRYRRTEKPTPLFGETD
jgi:DNA modification methylase